MAFGISELFAVIALIIAVIAIFQSRSANKLVRDANAIAKRGELRPDRVAVRIIAIDFFQFCSTLYVPTSKTDQSATDLSARLYQFEKKIDQYGPIGISGLDELIGDAKSKANQIHRFLNRLMGPNPRPIDTPYQTAEENLYGLVDWFSAQEDVARKLFEPYLK